MKHSSALVERITVEDRFRRDLGDIGPLADSVASLGLLHPIVVTSDLRLIAGHRRLEAVRKLGWREVDVRIADDLESAVELLAAERDENTCRLDMKPSELVALGRRLEELERPKARERQAHGETGPGKNAPARPRGSVEETRNVVGKALGVHGATYQRMKYVADRAENDATPEPVREVATQALAEMDAGTLGAETAQRRVRRVEISTAPGKPSPRNGAVKTKTHRGRSAADGGRRVVNTLVGLTPTFDDLDPTDLDLTSEEAAQWERDLRAAVSAINRFRKRLREEA